IFFIFGSKKMFSRTTIINNIDFSCRMFGTEDYTDFISSFNEIVIESTPDLSNNSSNSETSTNSEVDPETEEDC
ncbi:MAG: hypothetical protein MJ211_15545, partial [Bacteroidales bacterium]|nr:hypothetical protein [Bacteroidales bacterium]